MRRVEAGHNRAMPRTPYGKMPAESRRAPREIQGYLGRVSGPLLDRIDLHIEVPAVKFQDITSAQTYSVMLFGPATLVLSLNQSDLCQTN